MFEGQAVGEGLCAAGGDAFKVARARFDQPQCSHQRVRAGHVVGDCPCAAAGDAFKVARAKFDQPQSSHQRVRGWQSS